MKEQNLQKPTSREVESILADFGNAIRRGEIEYDFAVSLPTSSKPTSFFRRWLSSLSARSWFEEPATARLAAAGACLVALTAIITALIMHRPLDPNPSPGNLAGLPSPPATNSDAVFLSVGISTAAGDLPDGSAEQARSIYSLLSKLGYRGKLLSGSVTKATVLDALASLVRDHGEGAPPAVVIYWNGQGLSTNGQPLLVTADSPVSLVELAEALPPATDKQLFFEGSSSDSFESLVSAVESTGGSMPKWSVSAAAVDAEASRATGTPIMGFAEGLVRVSSVRTPESARSLDMNGDRFLSLQEAFDAYARSSSLAGGRTQKIGTPGREIAIVPAMWTLPNAEVPSPSRQPKAPTVNNEGQFWLYRDLLGAEILPFVPYGLMAGRGELPVHPTPFHRQHNIRRVAENRGGTVVDWSASFGDDVEGVNWVGVMWAAAEDLPPFWAEPEDSASRATYFDLSEFKSFRFSAKSFNPGVVLTAKVGPLSRNFAGERLKIGDSLEYPISARFELSQEWKTFEVELEGDLSEIVSVAFLLEKRHNVGIRDFEIWLDDIFFSKEKGESSASGEPGSGAAGGISL